MDFLKKIFRKRKKEREEKPERKLKVVWISSYLPRSCGIAYYSEDYIRALKKIEKNLDVPIISHSDALEATYPIISLGDRSWHGKVVEAVKYINPDIVHIQHEYGLYETFHDKNQRLLTLLKELKDAEFPTVMTYHSVYSQLTPAQAQFISESLKLLNLGIFHCQYQLDDLPSNINWEPENVEIIPHGSDEEIKLDKEECKKRFGYGGKNVVGLAGLASGRKGFDRVIKRWPEISRKIENAILVAEVKPQPTEESINYISQLSYLVAKNEQKASIELIIRDYTREEFLEKLRSFDILAMPYLSESQSGVLAHGFATGTPAVVRDIEGLGYEIKQSGAGIAAKDDEEIFQSIIELMNNPEERAKMEEKAHSYVKDYCGWNRVAKRTLSLYDQILLQESS